MSIENFAAISGFRRLFRASSSMENAGFMLIELLVAVAIFSGTTFLLFRYQWNIVKLKKDACLRLRAIDRCTSWVEEIIVEKRLPIDCHKKKDEYELDLCVDLLKIVRHNLPENLVLDELDSYRKISVTAKWKSISGKKNRFDIVTGVIVK